MGYLELDSEYKGEAEEYLKKEVHRFAKEEIRPVAKELDKLSYDEYKKTITSDGSPHDEVIEKMKELGYHKVIIPTEYSEEEFSGRELHILMEELGWGSVGFVASITLDAMPALYSAISPNDYLHEEILKPYLKNTHEISGCWAVTEPSHGSDFIRPGKLMEEGVDVDPPQLIAEKEGDEWVLNGVKSSWVSSGPIATHTALHANLDISSGNPGHAFVIPLDLDGISREPPIEKLGQRESPQSQLVFDNVRVPEKYLALSPEMQRPNTEYVSVGDIIPITSCTIAASSVGLARAAFEEALNYSRNRKQGGKPICEHQTVKRMLYRMFEKIESARSFSRTITEHVYERNIREMKFDASSRHSTSIQSHCKEIAFEVANTALQVHGGNGITKDYLVEKLFRDARVRLVADGTTEILQLKSADDIIQNYEFKDNNF